MGEAKPFENTTISAPRWAPVRVRNRDDGGGDGPEIQPSPPLKLLLFMANEKPVPEYSSIATDGKLIFFGPRQPFFKWHCPSSAVPCACNTLPVRQAATIYFSLVAAIAFSMFADSAS